MNYPISCDKCNDHIEMNVSDNINKNESELKKYVNETKKIINGKKVNVTGIQIMTCTKCNFQLFNVKTDLHPNLIFPVVVWNGL